MLTNDLAIFLEAHRAGSLSEAARRLGITPALASKRLHALEAELKVRLLHRSTRKLVLSVEGQAFLEHAEAVIAATEAARLSVAQDRPTAQGILRVTVPASFATKVLMPLIPDFLAMHPQLEVDLQLNDQLLDLHKNSLDAAIRIAPLAETNLIARKLCDNPLLLCASPSYLKKAGTPSSIKQLVTHECLALGGTAQWSFGAAEQQRLVKVHGRLRSNGNEVIREACVAGMGIGLHSTWDVHTELLEGKLVRISLELEPSPLAIWLVYSSRRHLPLRVQLFYELLLGKLGDGSFGVR